MDRILIIDDERGISEMIGQALQRSGYRVETASNGRHGIDLFDTGVFDLVVTDMDLPDIDGKGVIHHIRHSSRPVTPVIGMSGTPWLLQGALCDAMLSKPFPLKALTGLVGRLSRPGIPGALPSALTGFTEQPVRHPDSY